MGEGASLQTSTTKSNVYPFPTGAKPNQVESSVLHETQPAGYAQHILEIPAFVGLVALKALGQSDEPEIPCLEGQSVVVNANPGLINPWLINRGCPCFSGESSLLEVSTPLLNINKPVYQSGVNIIGFWRSRRV